ncbi:MAG: PAS domain-containing protein, partial [Burkholderiales bacterium]|nr:PAS domain-containing protein [Burkholderiales bacterium]
MTTFPTPPLPAAALDAGAAADLLAASAAALARVDRQGRVDWANPAALALAGGAPLLQPAASWLGLDAADSERLAQALADGAGAALRSGALQARASALADGARALTLTPLAPPHAAPIDARAVAIAGLACWRHDLESGRISHNDEARKIIGAAASPEGMTIQELGSRVHPDDRAAGLAASAAALAGDRATDTDLRMRSPDGHWRTILTRRGAERD